MNDEYQIDHVSGEVQSVDSGCAHRVSFILLLYEKTKENK